jgi:putative component of toxin-antitoxin plasmid stabilization module
MIIMERWMGIVVREFIDDRGQSPFRDWLHRLDTTAKARIQARVLRLREARRGTAK